MIPRQRTRRSVSPHSHLHRPRNRTSTREEFETSTARYRDFFGDPVREHRFPNGNVHQHDYYLLAEHGYSFDASTFLSWRPGHFNDVRSPTTPQYLPERDVFEFPFTVHSGLVRIPTSLSYCQVLGRPYRRLLLSRPPPVLVFNFHICTTSSHHRTSAISHRFTGLSTLGPVPGSTSSDGLFSDCGPTDTHSVR